MTTSIASHGPTAPAAALLALLLVLGSAAPLTGQDAPGERHTIRIEPAVRFATAYEGRGLTFHEGIAGQLTGDVVLAGPTGELRAGAWTNVELIREAAGPTMIDRAAPGLSEVNLYLAGTRALGALSLTGGWIYFLWPTGFDFSDAGPLHELFLGVAAPLPLGPGAAVGATAYYDFAARGTYAELRASSPLPAVGGAVPSVGVVVAGVVGQEEYYARPDGVTHVGVEVAVERPGRWTRIRPELRWTVAMDPATRVGAVRDGGRHKIHVGVSVAPR